MARKDTYKKNALDDMFDDFEDDDIKGEELSIRETLPSPLPNTQDDNKNSPEVTESTKNDTLDKSEPEPEIETLVPVVEQPKLKVKPSKKKTTTVGKIDFSKRKEDETTPRAFRIPVELDEDIKEMVSGNNGGRAKGSYGFNKAFANNALIKEMVYLGVLDESALDRLIPYD